jgi:hypothetical protein
MQVPSGGAEDIRFRPPPLRSRSRRHFGGEVAPCSIAQCALVVEARVMVIAIVYPSAG